MILFFCFSLAVLSQVPNGYNYRKTVQINGSSQIPGTQPLADFPVLFSVTTDEFKSVSNGGYVTDTNGFDIIFASTDSSQVFDHELEHYDPATGEVIAWVRIPSLPAGTNSTMAVHYGNPNINSDPSVSSTWNNNYQLVQHMDSGFLDATSRNNDGINNGTTDQLGQIYRTRNFDGSNDYIEFADDPTLDLTGNMTISMWVYIDGFDTINSPTLLTKGTPNRNYWIFLEDDQRVTFNYAPSGGWFGSTETSSNTALNIQQWYYLSFSFQNFFRRVYVNGANENTGFSFGTGQVNGSDLSISEYDFPFEGQIDEVRISNSARSANWITTEFNNQNDPNAFLSLVNDPPNLSNIETLAQEYKNGAPPTAVSNSIIISDIDGNEINSATIAITNNYIPSEDILDFTDQNGITHSWDSGSAQLTLSGSATVAEYMQALRSVTYVNSNTTNPSGATRTISFTVSDPDNSSNTLSRDLTVIPPNDPPVISGIEPGTLNYSEGDGQTPITSSITVSDSDNTNLDTAIVRISNNYTQGEDKLEFTNVNGIISSWDAASGTLMLTGSSSVTNYQAALRSVTYNNVSAIPSTATRTVDFTVRDAEDPSNTLSRNISVTETNNLPVIANIESARLQVQGSDPPQQISNTLTVADADDQNIDGATIQIASNYIQSEDELSFSDILGISGSWNSTTGTLTLSGSASKTDYQKALRSITYDNVSSIPSSISRTVSFTVTDGDTTSVTVTREIALSAVQSIPGLQLWLKGDAGVNLNGSNEVTSWEDQSGNNRDFTSAASTRPSFATNITDLNNQAAIAFTGDGDFLEDSDGESYINGSSEFTIFYVIQSEQINSDRGFFDTETPNNTDNVFSIRYDADGVQGGATNLIKTGIMDDINGNKLESFSDVQTTGGQILSLDWQSGQEYNLVVDGVLNNPSAISNPPSGTINNASTVIVGKGPKDAPNTPGQSWDGYIAEVIMYDRFLPLEERQAVEDYLSKKYNLAIRLIGKAKGGESISADTYASGTYTDLTGPRLREDFRGELTQGDTLTFQAPNGFEWDINSTPGVTVQPAYGNSTNLAFSSTVKVSAKQITFTVSQESNGSSKPGEAIFSGLRLRPTTGTLPNSGTITNIGSTGPGGTTNYGNIIMAPGQPNALSYTQQPTNNPVDQTISPTVELQIVDQFGNNINQAGTAVSVSLTSGTGNLSGTTTQTTNVTGTVYFNNLTIDQTGTKQLTASASTLPDSPSNNFDINNPGALSEFKIEKISGGIIPPQIAGVTFGVKITAIDGTGAVDTDFQGTVDIASNGVLDQGAGATPNFTNGVLDSYSIRYNNTGEFTLIGTNANGPENGQSNSFQVTPGQADKNTTTVTASPTFISNNGTSTSTITVQLKDSAGNNLQTGGATVSISTNAGTLGSVNNNGDGTYTAILTSSTNQETAILTATLNGQTIADNASVTFTQFDAIWRGSLGGDLLAELWNNPLNWISSIIPSPNDAVLIPADPILGERFPVIQNFDQTVGTLVIESGAHISISSGQTLTVTGDVTGNGEINGSNTSTLEVGGEITIENIQVGNVVLNGTNGLQKVESIQQFYNLEIDNPNHVEVADDLFITQTLTLTNGNLIIPSGKNLIANAQNVVGGALNFLRALNGMKGWRMISSPVASTYGDLLSGIITQGYPGATYNGNTPPNDNLQPNVLWYDETYEGTDNQRWRTPSDSSQSLTSGRGLFVYVFGNVDNDSRYDEILPDTLDVKGPEFSASDNEIGFNVSYTATADTGWNLVGNPFGAALNWDDNSTWTKNNIDETIYVWDPNANGGNGNFLTWNGIVGSLGSGLLAPFQGFWVKANGPNPELKVSKENKVIDGIFRRKETTNKTVPKLKLKLEADDVHGLSQEAFVMFSNQGKRGFDPKDGYRMFPFGENFVELYFKKNNGAQMTIENLPADFEYRYELPLEIGAMVGGTSYNGNYTISWPTMEYLPSEWVLKLIDNKTGEEINLKERSFYSFNDQGASLNAAMYTQVNNTPGQPIVLFDPQAQTTKLKGSSPANNQSRFTLIVTTEEIESEIPQQFQLDQNYPNPFNPTTTIEFGLPTQSEVTIEVYDILGRLVRRIASQQVYPAGFHTVEWTPNDVASGIYLYRVRTKNQAITKKMTYIK